MKLKLDKTNFEVITKGAGYNVVSEYVFLKGRKFRADWMIEINRTQVLIEYEGIVGIKSRHTSITGYTKDCEKYNLAQINGYIVLRYTAINFDDVFKDLDRIKKAKELVR